MSSKRGKTKHLLVFFFVFWVLVLEKPKLKPKNQKTKTLRRMFWFEVKRCFFLVFLGSFWFLLVLDLQKPKKPRNVLVFPLLLDKVNSKKQTIPSFFWFFGSWLLKKQKKPR